MIYSDIHSFLPSAVQYWIVKKGMVGQNGEEKEGRRVD
jgi:hypothetical protein